MVRVLFRLGLVRCSRTRSRLRAMVHCPKPYDYHIRKVNTSRVSEWGRRRTLPLNPSQHFTALGPMPYRPSIHREFRKQFFPEKSVNCECGKPLQTREHIIRTCARYEGQQGKLREVALHELLGTPKGIAALTEFIKDPDAFTFTGEKYTLRISRHSSKSLNHLT